MTNRAKKIKYNIVPFKGEWLNMYLDEESWLEENPMYHTGRDQEEILEQIAEFTEENPSVKIYAGGSRVW